MHPLRRLSHVCYFESYAILEKLDGMGLETRLRPTVNVASPDLAQRFPS